MRNQTRFAHALELSSRTQYRHMPMKRKSTPIGTRNPKAVNGSLIQNAIFVVSILMRAGVRASTQRAERKKSLAVK